MEPETHRATSRVLVVDDERMVTDVVERYLRREGYDVSVAADGAEALKVAKEWAPDLVVLDLMLPVVDGLEVCRLLRKDTQVPIIMLTARSEETDRVVGLELGADDYISKPFSSAGADRSSQGGPAPDRVHPGPGGWWSGALRRADDQPPRPGRWPGVSVDLA